MTASDHIANVGAIGAIGSPWWLPSLHTISEQAALILPIMGVVWLAVQITTRVYSTFRKPK